jgi:hypothetical protein
MVLPARRALARKSRMVRASGTVLSMLASVVSAPALSLRFIDGSTASLALAMRISSRCAMRMSLNETKSASAEATVSALVAVSSLMALGPQ